MRPQVLSFMLFPGSSGFSPPNDLFPFLDCTSPFSFDSHVGTAVCVLTTFPAYNSEVPLFFLSCCTSFSVRTCRRHDCSLISPLPLFLVYRTNKGTPWPSLLTSMGLPAYSLFWRLFPLNRSLFKAPFLTPFCLSLFPFSLTTACP